MSRKIIALEFITLDGVIQAPGGSKEDKVEGFEYGGWVGPFFDDLMGKTMEAQMEGDYDLLLGRKTYEIFAGYWPKHPEGWPQVNKITKYVVSKNNIKMSWENSKLLSSIEDVESVKETDGPPLQIYGSSNLMQSLLKSDLVDELWLKIFPITLGRGKKLFREGTIPAAWELLESSISPNGVIIASYKRAGKVETSTVGGD